MEQEPGKKVAGRLEQGLDKMAADKREPELGMTAADKTACHRSVVGMWGRRKLVPGMTVLGTKAVGKTEPELDKKAVDKTEPDRTTGNLGLDRTLDTGAVGKIACRRPERWAQDSSCLELDKSHLPHVARKRLPKPRPLDRTPSSL